MKLIHSVVLLLIVFARTYGWVAIELTYNGTNGEGDCVSRYPEVGIMELDEIKRFNGSCYKARCEEKGIIAYEGCGVDEVEDDQCERVEDLSKFYPDCCATFVCNFTTTENPVTESVTELVTESETESII